MLDVNTIAYDVTPDSRPNISNNTAIGKLDALIAESSGLYKNAPFIGNMDYLNIVRDDDPESIKPIKSLKVFVKILNTNNEKDMSEYAEILNVCANSKGHLLSEDKQFDSDNRCWLIMIKWCTEYYIQPSNSK